MNTRHSQSVFLGEAALSNINTILAETAAKRVFLVLDEAAYAASGAEEVMKTALNGLHATTFTGFEPNPKLEDVERGIELFHAAKPDLVIALGGGTAIDLGKLIASLGCQPADVRELAIGVAKIESPCVPLVAIPTTAGTGSEATHYAVVYVNGQKYSVAHESLLPAHALVDPRLTYSLPPAITTATGLDAFCQAIESIWAVGATDESIEYASEAVRLVLRHLKDAANDPTPKSRAGMSRASHLAGKAINISKTTLPHAISYAITFEHGLQHGIAVSLTLRAILAFNAGITEDDCVDPRGAEHVRRRIEKIVQVLGATSVADAGDRITDLLASIDCPRSLAEVGIADEDAIRQIVSQVNEERMSNNPRRASVETLAKTLMSTTRGPSLAVASVPTS